MARGKRVIDATRKVNADYANAAEIRQAIADCKHEHGRNPLRDVGDDTLKFWRAALLTHYRNMYRDLTQWRTIIHFVVDEQLRRTRSDWHKEFDGIDPFDVLRDVQLTNPALEQALQYVIKTLERNEDSQSQ